MKKKLLSALCLVLVAVLVSGCVIVDFTGPINAGFRGGAGIRGVGSMEVFTFEVGEITELLVGMTVNVNHHSTESDTITLEIQPNLINYVNIEEVNGVLTVDSIRTIQPSANLPVLTIGAPMLNRVVLSGAGSFTAVDPIVVEEFTLGLTGAFSGVAELDVDNLTVNLSGAGDLTLSGSADHADIILTGAGSVRALDLQTRTADIRLAGAGSVRIGCSEHLRVTGTGVGTVEYRGNPDLDITRGGLVTVRNVN